MPERLFFSTDELPARERFPAFCEEFVRRYLTLDIVEHGERPFRGAIELRRAGPVELGSHFNTPVVFKRLPHLLRDGNDDLFVALVQSGNAYHTQRGCDVELGPGDAIVCDNAYACEVYCATDLRFTSVIIRRSAMEKLLPSTDRLAGATLDRDDVARQLLFGYLGGTLDVESDGSGPAMQLYGEHIIDLVALALGAEGDAREFVEQRSVGAVRRVAILREIETRATDPGLNADTIASGLGITSRYLRLPLEETGRSFSQHVLEKRLDRAAGLLRDPRRDGYKVSAIAFECGFSDLSYFNRAFRRRFGETPSDARQNARRQNSDECHGQ